MASLPPSTCRNWENRRQGRYATGQDNFLTAI